MKTPLIVLVMAMATGACAPVPDDQLLVSAAASLTDVLGEVALAFEEVNPGVDVVLNLGSSSALREQILEGAPVDVFASADVSNMDQVTAAGAVHGAPVVFATNRLQIAVPAGNPGGITGLDDFAEDDLLIGLCAEDVPCGELGHQALDKAGVSPSIDTSEPDVRALLTKFEEGELDAGLTYVTDVLSARGKVEGVDIPDALNAVAEYPIAALAGGPNPEVAEAFVVFVLSDEGRAVLTEHGFGAP